MIKFLGGALGILLSAMVLAADQGVRPAAFAGQFYDRDPVRLAAEIDRYLSAAAPAATPSGKVLGLIAPHAGYVYSGRTAAFAYALVAGKPYEAVVIIGPSHRAGFEGCSIWPSGGFETPLGIAQVDAGLARGLAKATGFGFLPEAFADEHSVEVQVPFIQKALPKARIVPVVMGYQTKRTVRTLADGLAKACAGRDVLVVASTDLSHFLSELEAAAKDAGTISLIGSAETETLLRKIESGDNILCGGGPVVAAILYAQKAGAVAVKPLKRSDSSAAGGPADSVVGYLAAAILAGRDDGEETFSLTAQEKTEILRLARAAVTEYVEHGTVTGNPSPAGNAKFLAPKGTFVTLKKNGQLRGCIGFIEPVAPLGQAVVQAAIYAAAEDPRFPPVRAEELRGLEIEVSVLTPLREVTNPAMVQVGRHGLVISRGASRGLLLPQVAVENGWDRETFLEEACLKAGLPSDAWRRGARVFVFEAIVFHE